MDNAKSVFLCLCYVLIGSYGGLVPFIDKCAWDDNPCLKTSSQKALPHIAKGLPEFGMAPLDPMNIEPVTVNEGGLNLLFEDAVMTGASKCQIIDVKRDIVKGLLKFVCECPIALTGKYNASGELIDSPVYGFGDFHIKTDNIRLDVKMNIKSVDGSDGKKHWKLGKYEYTFDVKEKAVLMFDNLCDGDKEKAAPINAMLASSPKELVQTMGKPLVGDVIKQVLVDLQKLVTVVSADELELPIQ